MRMKRTQKKDAVRNILRQKVSYISIIVIAMLAVMAYLGIAYSSDAISAQAARYYDRMHFRDAEVISTLLITEDDLDAIRATEGVKDVEGVYTTNGKIERSTERQSVSVVSLTERVNTVEVKEGRLPATADECVIERELAQLVGVQVGDRIHIGGTTAALPDYLKQGDFTVVGIVLHPDLYGKPVAQIGSRYVLVRPEVFDSEALRNCYMKAEVLYDKPDGISMYDSSYLKLAKAVTERLDALTEPRAAARSAEVRGLYASEIDEGQKKLDDAEAELADARKTLDEKTAEILDGERLVQENEEKLKDAEQQLKEGEEKLNDAAAELAAGKEELDEAKKTLDDSRAQLDDAKKQLADAKKQLEDAFEQIEDAKTMIRDMLKEAVAAYCGQAFADSIKWATPVHVNVDNPEASASRFRITDTLTVWIGDPLDQVLEKAIKGLLKGSEQEAMADVILLTIINDPNYEQINNSYERAASACRRWNKAHDEYIAGLEKYREGEAKYAEGLAQYEEGLARYEEGLATYGENLKLFDEKKAEYEDGVAQLADAKQKIEDGWQQIRDGEAAYAEGLAEYEDGQSKLADAKDRMNTLDTCRWVVLDVNGNIGYKHSQSSAQNISRIGMTFSLLFVLVGALVIYATVGRMIEEQRRLVGTTKALGFFNREVLQKYMTFGLSATLLGVLLGIAVGYFAIEKIVLVAHQSFYVDGTMPRSFLIVPTIIITVIGAALAAVSVWTACASLVRAPARELMQERVPKGQKRAKKGKSHGSLYSRLILRNIRSDKKRVIVTVISIAGCCTLLMIGFTLRYGVSTAITRQYGEIMNYEQEIVFDPAVSATAKDEIESVLDAEGVVYSELLSENLMISAGGDMTAYLVITGQPEQVTRFYDTRDVGTGKLTAADGQGILIHKRLSERKDLTAGSEITLYDGKMNPYTVSVSGVYNNHFGRYVFLSSEGYKAIFGKEPVYNMLWISGSADPEALNAKLYPIAGYEGMTDLSEQRDSAQKIASILTLITGILIICAGLMAYFILLNLTGMYLAQKQRELTIMRINGFTTKEVVRYVSRETLFTTTLGIVLGLGLGMLMGYLILRFLEQDHVQFVRTITVSGILLSAAITALFTIGINAIALRKVRHLKLTDL